MKKYLLLVAVMMVGITAVSMALTIGLVLGNMDNPYFVEMANAAKTQAKALGAKLIVLNANYSNATQYNQVEDLIQRKIDAIVINPTDSDALVPAAEAAYKAGIPFVCIDRTVNSPNISLDIESNNTEAGEINAKELVKILGGKGNIAVILGTPGLSVQRERTEGFMQVVKKYPNIHIVAEQNGNFNMADGMKAAEAILTAHPNLDAIYAENDPMALGTVQAIKEFNRQGIKVFAIDASPQGLQALKKGEITFEAGQQPRKMTMLAVAAADFLARGFKLVLPSNAENKRYFLKVYGISKSNVDQWIADSVHGWH